MQTSLLRAIRAQLWVWSCTFHGWATPKHLFKWGSVIFLLVLVFVLPAFPASADNFPSSGAWPVWGDSSQVHFAPVAWPGENDWIPSSWQNNELNDPRTQDPSNGGTAPQNYVNVSSCWPDTSAPSVYLAYDSTNKVIFYRFKIEQIANTYGTGPSAGNASTSDPWNSAQWTVLIDTNGDGFRDFAILLNGSSGSPSTPLDRLVTIWSASKNQSVDYVGDSSVKLLFHNPSAFVNAAGGKILNFQSSVNPTTTWPNGNSATVWDYGTTRATKNFSNNCNEYIIDYQVPLAMLDATAAGGPKVTESTPLAFMYATANSLNNPFQKDVVMSGSDTVFVGDPNKAAPFGDTFLLSGEVITQPSISAVSASGCNSTTLTANIADTLNLDLSTTVTHADFYYYNDKNGNGQPDDSQSWTFATAGTTTNYPVGKWTANWNTTGLKQGQYLLGVKATDAQSNITWSYLAADNLPGSTPPNYANPAPTPGLIWGTFNNSCGTPPPSITKSASPSTVTLGQAVQFTVTLSNNTGETLTVSNVTDTLPPGFSYVTDSTGGTLGITANPSASGQTLTWSSGFPKTINNGSSATLTFSATAPGASNLTGTYQNVASSSVSTTGWGALNISSAPAQIIVGAPRLTLKKSASVDSAAPGGAVTWTLTYANDSPIGVTGAQIVDTLPVGLTNITPANGGTYASGAGTITWNIGAIAAGAGPFTVSFTSNIANPYALTDPIPMVNNATLTSNESPSTSASYSVFINSPRANLQIQKDANVTQVAQGGNVIFTLNYANTGNGAANGVVITDPIPTGFSFVSATNGGTNNSGTVTWNIGALDATATGSVQVTLQAANPFTADNPQTNTASITGTGLPTTSDSFKVAVTKTGTTCSTYYFHNENINVGFDGAKQQAIVTAPLAGETGTGIDFSLTTAYVEVTRFYMEPAVSTALNLNGATLTTNMYVNRAAGQGSNVQGTVYNYNPTTGAKTVIGTGNQNFAGNTTGLYTFTITGSGTLSPGNRLLWVFEAKSQNAGGAGNILRFQYGGNVTNTQTSGSTFADSNGQLCYPVPPILAIDKQANALSVLPGGTLQYTIKYTNSGAVNMTGTQIVDTLPTGTTFSSATMNSSAITPSINGQQLTFTGIRSSDTATAGQVTAGQGGTLIVNVTVNQSLSNSVTALNNTLTLSSNETTNVDARATVLVRPDLSIQLAVNDSALAPGDTATYTVTVTNNGAATATNLTISDVLPETAYYTFVGGSASGGGAYSSGTLTWTLASLAAGATQTYTFQMRVAASGVPTGNTTLNDTASVSSTQTASINSNTVSITISAFPLLTLSKARSPEGTLAGGDTLQYTLTLNNTGGGAAENVHVSDPLPANTAFIADSIIVTGGGTGSFDVANNRVLFDIGTLEANGSRTLQFSVSIAAILPSGTTAINNTATAYASNATGVTASANANATAAPVLAVKIKGKAEAAYPTTTLSQAANNTTQLHVVDPTQFSISQYVLINGTAYQITAINLNTLTLTINSAITADADTDLVGALTYTITYQNNGRAKATNSILTYNLPGGTTYHSANRGGSYHTGSGSRTGRSYGPTGSSGTVTWDLGTLLPDDSGQTQVTIFPDNTGTYDNATDITSTESTANDTTPTILGGLRVIKTTSTPLRIAGQTATYSIQVQNTSSSAAQNVLVQDTLPTGFAYLATDSITGYTANTGEYTPTVGDQIPTWGKFTIAANTTLTIQFTTLTAYNAGGQTYKNNVLVSTTSSMAVTQFDSLSTTSADVAITANPTNATLVEFGGKLDDTQIKLHWRTGTELNLTGFNVWRSTSADTAFEKLNADPLPAQYAGNTQGSTYKYADTALRAKKYFYKLELLGANDESTWSNIVEIKTGITPAPVTLKGEASESGIALTWDTASEQKITGFNVWRKLATGSTFKKQNQELIAALHTGTAQGATYTFTDAKAKGGSTYTYKIEIPRGGSSALWSSEINVEMPNTCNAAPDAPHLVSPKTDATVTEQQVVLKWKKTACAETYRVEIRRDSTDGKLILDQSDLTANEFQTKTLKAGAKFYWRVSACSALGCTASDWQLFKTPKK